MTDMDKRSRDRVAISDPENVSAQKRKQIDECRTTGKQLVGRNMAVFVLQESIIRHLNTYRITNHNILNQTLGNITLHEFVELAKTRTGELDAKKIRFEAVTDDEHGRTTLNLLYKTPETDEELSDRLSKEAKTRLSAEKKLKAALLLARKAGLGEEYIKEMLG